MATTTHRPADRKRIGTRVDVDLLSVDQAREMLGGVSVRFIQRLAKAGRIRTVVISTEKGATRGLLRVYRQSLIDYIASCEK